MKKFIKVFVKTIAIAASIAGIAYVILIKKPRTKISTTTLMMILTMILMTWTTMTRTASGNTSTFHLASR